MQALVRAFPTRRSPESLVEDLLGQRGITLLKSGRPDMPQGRYSLLAVEPFLNFRSLGARCELRFYVPGVERRIEFGNPWQVLERLLSRYRASAGGPTPFPLGGGFGYWGYDLRNFVEPKLPQSARNDLQLPDCHVNFYDSLVVFDHVLDQVWVVSTGLAADGSASETRAREQLEAWCSRLRTPARGGAAGAAIGRGGSPRRRVGQPGWGSRDTKGLVDDPGPFRLTLSREAFVSKVERALGYIHAGDVYQLNLSHRLWINEGLSGWEVFRELSAASPAPFAAYLDCGDFQIASSSPELFLRLEGRRVLTRPIKGTRARSPDPSADARLAGELRASAKERAELLMITDLLRNDLGKVCEFGSVQAPELFGLERYAHVHHLVSAVEGRLRQDVGHLAALASCFPGGSITGAPKFRAMEIIDGLEPTTRGPYTGALGFVGFNERSVFSILIRAAICSERGVSFPVGAGIVADSAPAAEYEETLAKAAGFFAAVESCLARRPVRGGPRPCRRPARLPA